ncbi:MAG TPA: DUF305 domain-containing protein [Pseudonocardiaceae bacterium]|nr:DUF305 domain-containing protein [Pseudonocardiaceae bacterium]
MTADTDPANPDSTQTDATERPTPRWMRTIMAGGVVVAVLLLGASLGLLVQLNRGPAQPDAASVDVGFSQDMSVHHRQAVLMAGLARDRSTDLALKSLAFDIERTQLEQVGRMQGWLSLWNAAPVATGPAMHWMTHESMPGMTHGSGPSATGPLSMPGMASPAELDQLRAAGGKDFDVLFLKLMLRHHQGGLPMAKYAAEHAETAQVRNLAEKIVVAQSAESDYLTKLITERGAAPFPAPI